MRAKAIICLALALLCAACAAAEEGTLWLTAPQGDRVALLAAPQADADLLGMYMTALAVEAGGASVNGFVPVRIGAQNGYVAEEALTTEALGSPALMTGTVTVNVDVLRRTPDENGGRAALISKGDQLDILGETANGWYYARKGSATGYAATASVQVEAAVLDQYLARVQLTQAVAETIRFLRPADGQPAQLLKTPDGAGEPVAWLWPGASVTVLAEAEDGWSLVRLDTLEGFLPADVLAETPDPALRPVMGTVVSESYYNLRTTPNLDADPAFFAMPGERFAVEVKTADGWYLVNGGTNFVGYIEEEAFLPDVQEAAEAATDAASESPAPTQAGTAMATATPAATVAPAAAQTATPILSLNAVPTVQPDGGEPAYALTGLRRLNIHAEGVRVQLNPTDDTALTCAAGTGLIQSWSQAGQTATLTLTAAAEENTATLWVPRDFLSAGLCLTLTDADLIMTDALGCHLTVQATGSDMTLPAGALTDGVTLNLTGSTCRVAGAWPEDCAVCTDAALDAQPLRDATITLPADLPAYDGGATYAAGEGSHLLILLRLWESALTVA